MIKSNILEVGLTTFFVKLHGVNTVYRTNIRLIFTRYEVFINMLEIKPSANERPENPLKMELSDIETSGTTRFLKAFITF